MRVEGEPLKSFGERAREKSARALTNDNPFTPSVGNCARKNQTLLKQFREKSFSKPVLPRNESDQSNSVFNKRDQLIKLIHTILQSSRRDGMGRATSLAGTTQR
jgi:hypothetical protein